MSKITNYLLCILSGAAMMMNVYAKDKDPNDYALMTMGDMKASSLSNITITNKTGKPVSASGLFIASVDINDCSTCFGSVISGDNLGGSAASPVTFQANQPVPIGQNYLYNMIYNVIYYIRTNVGSAPCALPGCTWQGDIPNTKWCISINITSLNSSYTYSNYTKPSNPPAKIPPYSFAGSSIGFDYNYDLINPNTLGAGNACLGPISCNDKTLTCQANAAQNESFQPYS